MLRVNADKSLSSHLVLVWDQLAPNPKLKFRWKVGTMDGNDQFV